MASGQNKTENYFGKRSLEPWNLLEQIACPFGSAAEGGGIVKVTNIGQTANPGRRPFKPSTPLHFNQLELIKTFTPPSPYLSQTNRPEAPPEVSPRVPPEVSPVVFAAWLHVGRVVGIDSCGVPPPR